MTDAKHMTDAGPLVYDLFDPVQVDNHQDLLARLRREAPVSELAPGLFYLSKYRDIVDVCRRPEIYRQGRHIPRHQDTRSIEQLNLGETDPPEHSRVRKVLASLLSPARVRSLEPVIRSACERIVDRFADRGRADITAELGVPVPGAVIGPLTGMPEELHAQFRRYADAYMMRTDSDQVKVAEANAIVAQFDSAAREVIRKRQTLASRPADLLTGLIESVDDEGQHLSEDKILAHVTKDMIVGGTETTKHLIGNLFFNLCSTPGAYERIRADRALAPLAVEETLRLSGPAQVVFRVPAIDVEIRGCPIAAGSTIALGYASGNLDEDEFDEAHRFSLDRGNASRKPHLGFGHGIHLCVGAALARLETLCALNAVLDRIANMELAPAFVYRRVRFFIMRGPESMDVQFDSA